MNDTKVIISVSTKYETDFPEHTVASEAARKATETLLRESTMNSLRSGGAEVISCRIELIQKTDKPTVN